MMSIRKVPITILLADDDLMFEGLVEVMRYIGRYWLEIVKLPAPKEGS